MERNIIVPRPDWEKKLEKCGFLYHSLNCTYWDESVSYSFNMNEILDYEKQTNDLYKMCLDTVQHVIDNKLWKEFHIPEKFVPMILRSWEGEDGDGEPSIYGRFDFSLKDGKLKMLEFNADTPTSLLEGSVAQWEWLQETNSKNDQWNSMHEKLVNYWKFLKDYMKGDKVVHFASVDDPIEDILTVEYMRDCAIQAGLETNFIYVHDIGWDENNMVFVDKEEKSMHNVFKLYPWEWMVNEQFGDNLLEDMNQTFWIEPAWKMILSNKALMPLMWKLYPNHPNLLPSYYEDEKDKLGDTYVKKPIFAREGANITIVKDGVEVGKTEGDYGEEGFIYQELCELPNFDSKRPLLGVWIIGGEAAGMGIREADGLITNNTSRFIPHYIDTDKDFVL